MLIEFTTHYNVKFTLNLIYTPDSYLEANLPLGMHFRDKRNHNVDTMAYKKAWHASKPIQHSHCNSILLGDYCFQEKIRLCFSQEERANVHYTGPYFLEKV